MVSLTDAMNMSAAAYTELPMEDKFEVLEAHAETISKPWMKAQDNAVNWTVFFGARKEPRFSGSDISDMPDHSVIEAAELEAEVPAFSYVQDLSSTMLS